MNKIEVIEPPTLLEEEPLPTIDENISIIKQIHHITSNRVYLPYINPSCIDIEGIRSLMVETDSPYLRYLNILYNKYNSAWYEHQNNPQKLQLNSDIISFLYILDDVNELFLDNSALSLRGLSPNIAYLELFCYRYSHRLVCVQRQYGKRENELGQFYFFTYDKKWVSYTTKDITRLANTFVRRLYGNKSGLKIFRNNHQIKVKKSYIPIAKPTTADIIKDVFMDNLCMNLECDNWDLLKAKHKHFLHCGSSIIDLHSDNLDKYVPLPGFFKTHTTDIDPKEDPKFEKEYRKSLSTSLGDVELANTLIRQIASVLVKGNKNKGMIFLYGKYGQEGKTALQLLIRKIFGTLSTIFGTEDLAMRRTTTGADAKLYEALDKNIVVIPEVPEELIEDIIRLAAGNDEVSARTGYSFTYKTGQMDMLFVLGGNKKLNISLDTLATGYRIWAYEFLVQYVPKGRYDERLVMMNNNKDIVKVADLNWGQYLEDNLSALLYMFIKEYREFYFTDKEELIMPDKMVRFTGSMIASKDAVVAFADEFLYTYRDDEIPKHPSTLTRTYYAYVIYAMKWKQMSRYEIGTYEEFVDKLQLLGVRLSRRLKVMASHGLKYQKAKVDFSLFDGKNLPGLFIELDDESSFEGTLLRQEVSDEGVVFRPIDNIRINYWIKVSELSRTNFKFAEKNRPKICRKCKKTLAVPKSFRDFDEKWKVEEDWSAVGKKCLCKNCKDIEQDNLLLETYLDNNIVYIPQSDISFEGLLPKRSTLEINKQLRQNLIDSGAKIGICIVCRSAANIDIEYCRSCLNGHSSDMINTFTCTSCKRVANVSVTTYMGEHKDICLECMPEHIRYIDI